MKTPLFFVLFLSIFSYSSLSQSNPKRLFVQVSNGAAGTIFGRSYPESFTSSTLGYNSYVNMRFLGSAQDYAIGLHMNKKVDIAIGYNRQRFTRWVKTAGRTNGVNFDISKKIQLVENSFYAAAFRKYTRKKQTISWGGGAGYIISQGQRVEIYPAYYIDRETSDHELVAFGDLGYSYRIYNQTEIGIKGQVWWIVSGSYVNSVSLIPYIRLSF